MENTPNPVPESPYEPYLIPWVSKEITTLKSDIEKTTEDPFERLATKYPEYKNEIFRLKDNPKAICQEYTIRKDKPYAEEFLPLCLSKHTRTLLYSALKQDNSELIWAIKDLLAIIDTKAFTTANNDLFWSLKEEDLQLLASKNTTEYKKPAVLEWLEYKHKNQEIWSIAVQTCRRIACLWVFQIPWHQSSQIISQFENITQKLQSYIQIEIRKRNITNRWTYDKVKNTGPTVNGVEGLFGILSEAGSTPYFMKWLNTLCKASPLLTENWISIFATGTQKVIWTIDIFMNELSKEQQISLFSQTLSNYNTLSDSKDPLYQQPDTSFKLWLLKWHLNLKDEKDFIDTGVSTGIEKALAKWLRSKNRSLEELYRDMKSIEHALNWTSDVTKKILYEHQIKDIKEKMISQSSLSAFLSHELTSHYMKSILTDKYARQILVHTIGSELWYLLENTEFLASEKWKKLMHLCFEWLASEQDDQDLRQIETTAQTWIADKRIKEWYLYPHQELIYTYGMRNTLMLYHFLSNHPQNITIGKQPQEIISSSSLLAWVLQRYQQDTYKNPYRTIDAGQITTYVQQLQTDIQQFIQIPENQEQKKQTTIMALYPWKGDDANNAFSNYTTYINTLKAQWYWEVIAISSDKYEKKTDNPAEKYWPDKFIEDVQKKIGTHIIGPLKASQQPKYLHIMIALHGWEDGSAQMWKTPFTRQHFEKLVNFSETIKKQYPQSAQYFSLTIDSCFSGNKFDQNPNFVSNIKLASSANVGTSKQTNDMIQAYESSKRHEVDFNQDENISFNESRLYTILQNPDKYMPTSFWDTRTGKTTVLF